MVHCNKTLSCISHCRAAVIAMQTKRESISLSFRSVPFLPCQGFPRTEEEEGKNCNANWPTTGGGSADVTKHVGEVEVLVFVSGGGTLKDQPQWVVPSLFGFNCTYMLPHRFTFCFFQ